MDGIRALAVAAVLAFHGGVPGASGGFLGVDAFFVLSGYLITTLLLREWQRSGTIALASFWGRRARRLLPALLLVLVTVMLTASVFVPRSEVRLLRGDGLASLFYVANWRMTFRGDDYFTQTAAPSPLEHMWSLGIEEQFYLLWPILLVALLVARRSLRLVLVVCVAGAAVSTVTLALLYSDADPGRAYYGTDTRAASLLLGAALATWLAMRTEKDLAPQPRRLLSLGVVVAVVALAWAWTHAAGGNTAVYHGGLAVAALAVVIVLAHLALVPGSLLARLLSVAPLRGLGLISYGVYLWHWPVFLAADAVRTGLSGWDLFGTRCLVTVVVAALCYRLIERPFRSGLRLRRPVPALSATAGAVAACSALVIASTVAPTVAQVSVVAPAKDGLDQVPDTASGPPAPAARAAARHKTVPASHHRRPGHPLVVDVFGDSVAWSLVVYLPANPQFDLRDRTSLGCGITTTAPFRYFGRTYPSVMPKCRAWQQRWTRAIAVDNPDIALVLVGRWETMDRTLGHRWVHLGDPAFDAHLRSQLNSAVKITGARGAHVMLATEPYNRRGEQPNGSLYPEDDPQRVTAWNQLLRGVAATHPGVGVLEFGARVSPAGHYSDTAGGIPIRADGLHLTPQGVQEWIAPWLFDQLAKAAP